MILSETYDVSENAGIIKTLADSFTWLSDDSDSINYEYYLNHSGDKTLSPLAEKIYNLFPDTYLTIISKIITSHFKDKWNRLYAVFVTTDYKPIENYSLTEEYDGTTGKMTTMTKGTTNTATTNVKTNYTNETTVESGIQTYGFNSSAPVNQNDSNGTTTTNTKGDSADNESKTTSENSGSDTDEENETDKHTLTRSGNIGVTTTQQMIESELQLRKWNFYNKLMDDIDTILCLSIYN